MNLDFYAEFTQEELDRIADFLTNFDPDFVEFMRLLWVATAVEDDKETYDACVPDLVQHSTEMNYNPIDVLLLIQHLSVEMSGLYPELAELGALRRAAMEVQTDNGTHLYFPTDDGKPTLH